MRARRGAANSLSGAGTADPHALAAGQVDLWVSGQVASDQSLHQVYLGSR